MEIDTSRDIVFPETLETLFPSTLTKLLHARQMMRRPRVLLADDHTLLLDAFAKLLEPECDVVGTVADGRALLAAAEELKPDVVERVPRHAQCATRGPFQPQGDP